MPARDDADDATKTKAPAPVDEVPGRRRVLVFWEGGFTSAALEDGARLTLGRASSSDIPIPHTSVSRAHAVLVGGDPPRIEDLGSANGTKIDGVKLGSGQTAPAPPGTMIELGSVMVVVQQTGARAPAAAPERGPKSPMDAVQALVTRVAASTIGVLLLGETGVGKGVVAEEIHRLSPRAKGPLLPLNCGALPESLLEAELFGYERGAFTGAVAARPGLIESAHGGTLFLDEVGELPPATQVRLLRVLENREVMRVGARRPEPLDVRFIAATNRDLEDLIRRGAFREDLYYRLNGISITIPPLRERRGEIDGLARRFAAEARTRAGEPEATLAEETLAALRRHDWPGNVRELRNMVERAVLLAGGARLILPEHVGALRPSMAPPRPAQAAAPASSDPASLRDEMQDLERTRIAQALERAGGNQGRAAELLGISRRTLLRRLDEYGLPRPRKDSE